MFDVQKFSVNKFNWDEGEKSILNLFGTSIQHPEDHLVQYFCDTEHTPIERRSPRLSPRKNLPESDNSVGRQLFSVVSPGRGDADLPGQVGAQGDNERGKEGQGGEDDNVAGGDADLPGQVGAQGDNDQGKEGQGGVNDNVADQRKGSKDTDQGDVCPTVEKEKTASPRRSDRKKNPPETIIEKRKKVYGGVNDPSNEQEDGSDEKGQGGVGVFIGVSCDQDRTDDKIQESSNPDKNKKPNKSKKINMVSPSFECFNSCSA